MVAERTPKIVGINTLIVFLSRGGDNRSVNGVILFNRLEKKCEKDIWVSEKLGTGWPGSCRGFSGDDL